MTDIKFRIIEKHPDQHSIVVRFYSDVLTEMVLASERDASGNPVLKNGKPIRCRTDMNLNIWDVNASANSIISTINTVAPYQWFQLQHDILDEAKDTSLSVVDSLIGQEFTAVKPEPTIVVAPEEEVNEIIQQITEEDVARLVAEMTGATANTA